MKKSFYLETLTFRSKESFNKPQERNKRPEPLTDLTVDNDIAQLPREGELHLCCKEIQFKKVSVFHAR